MHDAEGEHAALAGKVAVQHTPSPSKHSTCTRDRGPHTSAGWLTVLAFLAGGASACSSSSSDSSPACTRSGGSLQACAWHLRLRAAAPPNSAVQPSCSRLASKHSQACCHTARRGKLGHACLGSAVRFLPGLPCSSVAPAAGCAEEGSPACWQVVDQPVQAEQSSTRCTCKAAQRGDSHHSWACSQASNLPMLASVLAEIA